MSDDLPEEMKPGLERLQAKLQSQLDAVRKTKIGINALYDACDLPAPYMDVDEGSAIKTIRRGQFYGQPLATNVRAILEMRRAAGLDAASVNEIYQALLDGGYAFEAKDHENAKAGLRQSLRKNPIFHRIPSGEWGLLAWYPNAKVEKDDDDSNGKKPEQQPTMVQPASAPAQAELHSAPHPTATRSKPPIRRKTDKAEEAVTGGDGESNNEQAASAT